MDVDRVDLKKLKTFQLVAELGSLKKCGAG